MKTNVAELTASAYYPYGIVEVSSDYSNDSLYDLLDIEGWCNDLTYPNVGVRLLALDNKKVVGHVRIKHSHSIAKGGVVTPWGFLYSLVVHPDYRNQGLGKKLVSSALRYCQLQNFTIVSLSVVENNLTAIWLYSSLGFEISSKKPRNGQHTMTRKNK